MKIDYAELSAEKVARLHRDGAAARTVFNETLVQLLKELAAVDATAILARVGLSVIMNTPEGKRLPKSIRLELYHLELIQALALSKPRGSTDANSDIAAVTQRVIELIDRNGEAYREQSKSKVTQDSFVNRQTAALDFIQNWTFSVRGARQSFQTREYAHDLAVAVNPIFRRHYGCDATEVVSVLSALIVTIGERMRAHLTALRAWIRKSSGNALIEAYLKTVPHEEMAEIVQATQAWRRDRKRMFAYLWNRSEDRLASIFTFTYDELTAKAPENQRSALAQVLRGLAFEFGSMAPEALQHLHLNNPMRLKPFIGIGESRFFCATPQTVGTQLSEILENLCASAPKIKTRAEKARAEWLEKRLSSVIRESLPHAEVRDGLKWHEGDSSTVWEHDVVAVIDKTVLIFEAKSGKISAPARRGAIGSLKEALRDLVVAPSEQSMRLKQHLLNGKSAIEFETKQGSFVIDAREVRDVIRVNILQEAVGPLSSHWPLLKSAGLIPEDKDIAPSMTVFDLESVFLALSLEIERCHYLSRRAELERNAYYAADEMDLLAVYVDTQFNIGNSEFDDQGNGWYGKSLDIAAAFLGDRGNGSLPLRIKRTPFWSALLASLETRRPQGWTRFGHRLLAVPLEMQRDFERLRRKGIQDVKRQPSQFFTSGMTFGPDARLQTISINVGPASSLNEIMNDLRYGVGTAFEQGRQDSLLAIYWSVPESGEVYDFMGTFDRPAASPLLSIS